MASPRARPLSIDQQDWLVIAKNPFDTGKEEPSGSRESRWGPALAAKGSGKFVALKGSRSVQCASRTSKSETPARLLQLCSAFPW